MSIPHPGVIVRLLLNKRGLDLKRAAPLIHVHKSHLTAIVYERVRLTPRIARQIVTGLQLNGEEAAKLFAAQGRYDLAMLEQEAQKEDVSAATRVEEAA